MTDKTTETGSLVSATPLRATVARVVATRIAPTDLRRQCDLEGSSLNPSPLGIALNRIEFRWGLPRPPLVKVKPQTFGSDRGRQFVTHDHGPDALCGESRHGEAVLGEEKHSGIRRTVQEGPVGHGVVAVEFSPAHSKVPSKAIDGFYYGRSATRGPDEIYVIPWQSTKRKLETDAQAESG